jgi:Zn-dependent protease
MAEPARALAPARCAGCSTELPPARLDCPACRRLVHAEALRALPPRGAEAEARGDAAAALAAWGEAHALLPAGTKQHEAVAATVARLSAVAPPVAPPPPSWLGRLGPLAAVGLLLWKVVGVAKLGAVLSLFASFAVYWAAFGWRFAAGLLASMYVHELGHVIALRRAGIPAGAPMFIPGLGAYVRLHAPVPDARTNARVGLAGPLAGLAITAVLGVAATVAGSPLLGAVAYSGAVMNLFNLVPIWQLDGSRGLSSLARWERFALLGVAIAALVVSREQMLWLVVIVLALRAASPAAPDRGDPPVLAAFAALVVALAGIAAYAR